MKHKFRRFLYLSLGFVIIISIFLRFALWGYYLNHFVERSPLKTLSVFIQLLFFTKISNILCAIYSLLKGFNVSSKIIYNKTISLCLSSYILITMAVYFTGVLFGNLLFCGYLIFDVINIILHLVVPVLFLTLEFFEKREYKLSSIDALKALIFPLVYSLFISVVSGLTGWYPYFFLDPTKAAMLFGVQTTSPLLSALFVVLMTCAIALIILLVVFILIGINNYVLYERFKQQREKIHKNC